jgi:hypothetical protein
LLEALPGLLSPALPNILSLTSGLFILFVWTVSSWSMSCVIGSNFHLESSIYLEKCWVFCRKGTTLETLKHISFIKWKGRQYTFSKVI